MWIKNDNIYINKGISGDYAYNFPSNIDSNVVVIELLKKQNKLSTPIEVIEGIKFPDGRKKITNAHLTLYKQLSNSSVVSKIEYSLQGPIDTSLFKESKISVVGTTTKFLFDSVKYICTKKYKTYTEYGELVETEDQAGIVTSFKYSDIGPYLIAKGINTPYDKIKDYNGEQEPKNLGDDMHVTTYAYSPLVGVTRETKNGFSTYYTYDSEGNLLFVKDNDKNIRELYKNNIVNGSGQNNFLDYKFFNKQPKAELDIHEGLKQTPLGGNILYIDPAFEYELDFGDNEKIVVKGASYSKAFGHYYNELGRSYTVTLKEKHNGKVVNVDSKLVEMMPRRNIRTEFDYRFISTNVAINEINNENFDTGIKVRAEAFDGIRKYTITWTKRRVDLNNKPNTSVVTVVDNIFQGQYSEYRLKAVNYATYELTCTITDGVETIRKTWRVTFQPNMEI